MILSIAWWLISESHLAVAFNQFDTFLIEASVLSWVPLWNSDDLLIRTMVHQNSCDRTSHYRSAQAKKTSHFNRIILCHAIMRFIVPPMMILLRRLSWSWSEVACTWLCLSTLLFFVRVAEREKEHSRCQPDCNYRSTLYINSAAAVLLLPRRTQCPPNRTISIALAKQQTRIDGLMMNFLSGPLYIALHVIAGGKSVVIVRQSEIRSYGSNWAHYSGDNTVLASPILIFNTASLAIL